MRLVSRWNRWKKCNLQDYVSQNCRDQCVVEQVIITCLMRVFRQRKINKVSPRGRRDDMPPADGSSIQKSRRTYVRPRTGPQSAHLWWPAGAQLQAASVPIVQAGTDRRIDRQTDGSRYRLMPPTAGDIIILRCAEPGEKSSKFQVFRKRRNNE